MASDASPQSRTFEDITNAFLSLLQEYPFPAVKVGDIIQRSRYSRGTFYSYFQNKDDCMKKIIEAEISRTFDTIRSEGSPSCAKGPRETASHVLAFLNCVYEHRAFYDILLQNMLEEPMNQYYAYYSYQFRKEIDQQYSLADQQDVKDLYTSLYMHALMGMVEYWKTNRWALTPEELYQQYLRVLALPRDA